jgi:hypothetical protein
MPEGFKAIGKGTRMRLLLAVDGEASAQRIPDDA